MNSILKRTVGYLSLKKVTGKAKATKDDMPVSINTTVKNKTETTLDANAMQSVHHSASWYHRKAERAAPVLL
jgi:hypothetical protein